jgi:hypothetical protein
LLPSLRPRLRAFVAANAGQCRRNLFAVLGIDDDAQLIEEMDEDGAAAVAAAIAK